MRRYGYAVIDGNEDLDTGVSIYRTKGDAYTYRPTSGYRVIRVVWADPSPTDDWEWNRLIHYGYMMKAWGEIKQA